MGDCFKISSQDGMGGGGGENTSTINKFECDCQEGGTKYVNLFMKFNYISW